MTSPHFLRATLAMLLASASFSAAAGSTPPVVLKGLDPVRLVSGEEKPGQPAFH